MRGPVHALLLLAAVLRSATEAAAQEGNEARVVALAERARLGDATVVPDLEALLGHPDWSVRWHAARGIGLSRADWLDERLAEMLDDERVAPMAALAIGQLLGRSESWPSLDRQTELIASAKRWWAQQEKGEGWITHTAAIAPDLGTSVRGQVHAERGTAYLVLHGRTGREIDRRRCWGPVRTIAFSGDSATFAASDDRGRVSAFAVHGRELLREFSGHAGWLWRVALSHDGALLASSSRDGLLVVREVAGGAERWRRANCEAVAMQFVADTATLVAADRAGRLLAFTASGEATILGSDLGPVVALAVSADGASIAVLQRDGELSAWWRDPAKTPWHKAAHSRGARAVAFTSDGEIATAGGDGFARLWAAHDGAPLGEFPCERTLLELRATGGTLCGVRGDGSLWRADIHR